MKYHKIDVPADGEAITVNRDHSINVPDKPIIPYVVGDGIGIDVTPVMKNVADAAVERAHGKKREIKWMRVYAGAEAADIYGSDSYLPDETIHAMHPLPDLCRDSRDIAGTGLAMGASRDRRARPGP